MRRLRFIAIFTFIFLLSAAAAPPLSAQQVEKKKLTLERLFAYPRLEGRGAASREHRHEPKRIILLQPIRLLTADVRYDDATPAPSPDGKHVIFSRVEAGGKGRRRLWIIPAGDGSPRLLTPSDFDWDCTRPSWSRDGQWVAFRASRKVDDSERGGIWIMPASGGAPRQLTGRSPAEDDYYPRWFPDGRQMAVLRDVPGTESDVWVVALDGTASRLTTHPAFDGKSTISPDGRWIAFPSERGGARDIWVMPVAEGESAVRQFTFDGGRGPAWSPDGRWIAYGCPVLPTGYALCLRRVEGGPVIQVTDGSRNDFNPEWGPDGTWIAVAQGDDDAFGRIAIVDVGDIVAPSKAGSGRITQNMVPTPEEGPQLVLSFATYLGGSGRDDCDAVAVDRSGSIYLACHSNSKEFPLATSTPEMDRESRLKSSASSEDRYDAFVVKLDPTGSRVIYTTVLGGSRWEGAAAITVDASGNVYVAGKTQSPDLPTTAGAFQTSFGGDYDVYVAKLDASGTVVYCTYLGGSGEDGESDIAVDEAGNVYVVGTTWSKDFPTSQGALQRTLRGKQDAFVAKLDATGSVLLYSTFLGGQDDEEGWSIALTGEGNLYVTGKTRSKDFIVTPDALQQSLAGGADVFISKLDARVSNILYSTYLGGSKDEDIWDDNGNFAVDAEGHLYVAGATESHNFPTTPNAFQRNFAGGEADAFLAKLDLSNPRLVYSTYLGGSRSDGATGVGVNGQGRAVVTGQTDSPNFPVRNGVQSSFGGGESDAFLVELSRDGSALLYSTYLGGNSSESTEDIAVHATGSVYVSGLGDSDFPVVAAIQAAYGGGENDIILARFDQRSADCSQWKILFESERDGHREIYVMNHDGSNQQRTTHTPGTGEGSWSPRWSPDRTRIAFTSTREGNLNQVYVMDADGSNVQRLTHAPGKESANPGWSPDGKRIAFESERDGKSEIYVMEADGSNVHRLTHTKGRGKHSENPDWSPDGKRIVFESNRDGNYEIYVMDADGANVHRLTHRPGRGVGTWRPRWSPDGTKIAFSSGRERDEEIYTMNPDGSDLRRLTHAPGESLGSRHPAWSPDGKKIVFQSTRDRKSESWYHDFEMYVMDADGSNVRRLTFNQAWDGHPDW